VSTLLLESAASDILMKRRVLRVLICAMVAPDLRKVFASR
jgi:hypothetical protein